MPGTPHHRRALEFDSVAIHTLIGHQHQVKKKDIELIETLLGPAAARMLEEDLRQHGRPSEIIRADLIDRLLGEFGASGINADGEANDRGLLIEALIDRINDAGNVRFGPS